MTSPLSPWSREYAESGLPQPGPPDPPPASTTSPRKPARHERPAPDGDRRRRVLVFGVALALVAVVVIAITRVVGDDEASPSATTIDPFELAQEVTTPPTLVTVPAFDPTATLPPTAPPASPPAPLLTTPPFTLPEFEPVAGVTADELAAYDLVTAVANNAAVDQPMRTMYEIEGDLDLIGETPPGEPAMQAIAMTDPTAGRNSLTLDYGTTQDQIVTDAETDAIYKSSVSQGIDVVQWIALTDAEMIRGTGATDTAELFANLVSGPITPAVLSASTVSASADVVRIAGGAFARRYEVTVPAVALRPYGGLLLASVTQDAVEAGWVPEAITFDVYVTDQPALAMVVATFDVFSKPRLFTQYFDRVPANVVIELPPPDAVIARD